MSTIDVTDAPQRLLANKTVTPGHCLQYNSRAIRNGQPPLIWQGLDTAWDCWQYACGDKHDSWNVPLGFPAFLGQKPGSPDGDVILSRGDGTFAATDYPRWGVVGVCTLEQRETQTGRKYVGYAGEFLGYTLTNTTTASLDATPIEQEEDPDMSRIIHHPNGSMALAGSDGTFIPLTTMDEVAALVGTGAVPKDYVNLADGLMWNLRTAIAARKAAQASTNPQAVAAALAPLIVPAVITALGKGLTQAQVEQATETAIRAVFADAATK